MYHAAVGRVLKKLTRTDGLPALQELETGTARGSRWQINTDAAACEAVARSGESVGAVHAKPSGCAPQNKIVRKGHYRTLDYMQTNEFRKIKQLLESYAEIGGVYFRPTDRGATMVDLHPHSLKPRVGIGADPLLRVDTSADAVESSIPERIQHLRSVRSRQRSPSRENQLEARMIREAQANHLVLPGFPDRLRFVHSQWRIHLAGGQRFTDLLAVDLKGKQLVLIELKREPDPSALGQVTDYVRYFEG
jgi:hypothetical protein